MLNMLVTSYAKMKTIDSEATRRDFEKKAMAILGTNAVLMASIAAADTAFKDFVRNSIRGEDDDDMLFAFEKSKDKYGRATDNALKRQIMRSVGTSLAGTSIGLVEGGDDAWRLIQGGYGAVTGKKYLSQRALQGQFLASELTAIYGALESAGTMGRQKVKMREATSISEYMTAKRSYAYSAGKLYQSLSQVVGVGLHLPTRMLDYGVNPKERIRKAVFE
jgi:hypothetical protein